MTDTPDDDLAERGRAIFDRLRDLADDETAPDHEPEPSPPTADEQEAVGAAEHEPEAADQASSGDELGPTQPPPDDQTDPDLTETSSGDEEVGTEADQDVPDVDPAPVARDLPGLEDLAEITRVHEPSPEAPTSVDDSGPTLHAAAVEADAVAPDEAPSAVLEGPGAPTEAAFERDLPRVIAIANQKGGVGKTTTAVNLSACLAELGYRVLVVDLDPQGNATTGLGVNPRNLQLSMYDVLLGDRDLDDCIEPTSVRGLFVAPSSLDLAGAEIELVPVFSREMKLRRAVEPVREDFDYVLIDCPPSLGLLTVNGLAAAGEVVVPIQCEYYALEGLGQLLRNVTMVQQNLNPDLELAAIILVMFDARTKLSGEVVREVRTHFGPKVCRNIVPRTVRLSEAPSFGQPIIAFDPSSRGAIAYRELAKELSGGPAPAGVAP